MSGPRWESIPGSDWSRYPEAIAVVCAANKVSCSLIQRILYCGYNQAARFIERMEEEGVAGPPNNVGQRTLLRNPNIPAARKDPTP